MKTCILFFSLLLCLAAPSLRAVDPGAQQDAEAAREKLLKAADQLDNIQSNSEATRTAVDGMKDTQTKLQNDVAALQVENASLKQQLADLQAQFATEKVAHEKEQKVLVDSVAGMIASSKESPAPKPHSKKKEGTSLEKKSAATDTAPAEDSGTKATEPPPDAAPAKTPAPDTAADTTPPPVKTQKGYYHIVASGETLTMICNAYKEQGVKVSVADVRKANSLTEKSVLKVGQKLFIPKPGA